MPRGGTKVHTLYFKTTVEVHHNHYGVDERSDQQHNRYASYFEHLDNVLEMKRLHTENTEGFDNRSECFLVSSEKRCRELQTQVNETNSTERRQVYLVREIGKACHKSHKETPHHPLVLVSCC